MRIAISGTACQGKTTLVKDFLDLWPSYSTPEKTYRDILKENNLEHSTNTSKDTQRKILDFMIEEQQKYLTQYGRFQPRGLASDRALAHYRNVWNKRLEAERLAYPPDNTPIKNAVL